MTKAICFNPETGELYASGTDAWRYYSIWCNDKPIAYAKDVEKYGFNYETLLDDAEYCKELSRFFRERIQVQGLQRRYKQAGLVPSE